MIKKQLIGAVIWTVVLLVILVLLVIGANQFGFPFWLVVLAAVFGAVGGFCHAKHAKLQAKTLTSFNAVLAGIVVAVYWLIGSMFIPFIWPKV